MATLCSTADANDSMSVTMTSEQQLEGEAWSGGGPLRHVAHVAIFV
jgi:hypothetical protein